MCVELVLSAPTPIFAMTDDTTILMNTQSMTKEYYLWKVGQINVQTCSDDQKLHLSLQECSRANLDIVCFQEVRLLNTGSINHLGYEFYWCGMKRLKRNGVAIAIKKCIDIVLNGIINISDRLMAADLTIKGCKVRIICCYAPTLNSSTTSKQAFYRELHKLTKVERNRKIMIQGDFNCEPQFCRTHSCYDGRKTMIEDGSIYTNENSMLFLDFCKKAGLSILNTWFDHPIIHRITWHHPNNQTKKVYDYSLSEPWLRQHVTDVRVRNSFFSSDHRLVVTRLKTPANKAARQFIRKARTSRPDLEQLQNESIYNTVKQSITSHIQQQNMPNSLNESHEYIIDSLRKGRTKVPTTKRNSNLTTSWTDDLDLQQLINSRTILRKKPPSIAIKSQLKSINKQIKQKVKEVQNKVLKEKASMINEAKQHRKVVQLWRRAKSHSTSDFKKCSTLQCPGLKSHFSHHLNPDQSHLSTPKEVEELPNYIKALQDENLEIVQSPPSADEIQEAVLKLNNRKSAIDVESEFLKLAINIPDFLQILRLYYKTIWETKQVPHQWMLSRITPIWKKKGNASDPSKYRGISIGSSLCKLGMTIILQRLSPFYENQLQRTQFGFRSGLGCNDGIYAMKQLQDIATLADRKLFCCFIDLSAAFDHVNRQLLFKIIRARLPPNSEENNIQIIENLYKSTKSYLQKDNPTTSSFDIKSGVRQGEKEGPPFYNLYSDFSLRVTDYRKNQAGIGGLRAFKSNVQFPYSRPETF